MITNLGELRSALYVYTMATGRKDLKPETLERLEYRVLKACADVAFPVQTDEKKHPSNPAWAPQEEPTAQQARLAKGFLKVLEGGKQD